MKEPTPGVLQTIEVIGLAFAAVVGSIAGAATTFFLISNFGIATFTSNTQLTDAQVDTKIVELLEEEEATIAVVERVTPAVASIVVKKEFTRPQRVNGNRFQPLELNEEQEVETDLVEVSSGTGFFVTEDGYMLTNKHVVDEHDAQFFVVTNDGVELPAELVDVDPYEDIAVIKVEGEGFQVATLGDSENIKIGQTVIAIGNTLSEFRNTVTKGVVSGIDREITAGGYFDAEVIDEAIQTDAAINPGNSGGPLINLLGEVIGINTAVSYEGESVAFAIPINEAKQAVADVLEYGRIIQPWLGVRYVLVTPDASGETAGMYEIGAWVVAGDQPGEIAVFEDSPADNAGLQEGDIIIAVNGEDLTESVALAEAVSAYRPGDTITLRVLRGEEVIELEATLEEYQAE